MLADVAGYSAMMERDEAGTHLRLREIRAQITDPAIERHYGRIVRSRGDDLLVEFASAVEALSCAVEIQRAMAEHNRGLVAASRIEFRIGVNLGDILIDGTDIAGDGVNVAARLEALAQPGEISISQAVREQVRQLVGVRLTDAGQHRVKNISRPIRVFKVNLDGAAGAHAARWMRWRRPVIAATALLAAAVALWAVTQHARIAALLRDPAPPLSLAVLPVIDATGDPRGAQAARQLTGQLTAAMSHMAGGPVTAEAIAAASAARSADARAVGRELDVRYVATARLLALAPRHRLAAALVSTDSGAQLWSSTIEAEVQAGDDVPIELVGRIADTLVSELRTAELKRAPAADNDATTLTLRARAMLPSTDTVEGLHKARQLFEQAVQLAPAHVGALSGLASTLVYEADRAPDPAKAAEWLKRADDVSLRAITAAPSDAEAWRMRALVLQFRGQLPAAMDAVERSLQLNPYSSEAYAQHGLVLTSVGRSEDAVAAFERAIRLNPSADTVGVHLFHRARALLYLGRYDEAIASLERGMAFTPDWTDYMLLTAAYAMKGDATRARGAKDELLRREPGFTIKWLLDTRAPVSERTAAQRQQHLVAGLRRAGVPE